MNLIEFKDKPDLSTPINKKNLNHNFNEIKEKIEEMDTKLTPNYIIATSTDNQTLSSNYIVSLNKVVESCGDKLTLANGKIVIGAGVSKIRASGSIFVNAPSSSGYVWGATRKGTTHIGSNITYASSGTSFMSSSIPANIISVQEGDTIDLMADSTCGGVTRSGRGNTWLCVEVIE